MSTTVRVVRDTLGSFLSCSLSLTLSLSRSSPFLPPCCVYTPHLDGELAHLLVPQRFPMLALTCQETMYTEHKMSYDDGKYHNPGTQLLDINTKQKSIFQYRRSTLSGICGTNQTQDSELSGTGGQPIIGDTS
jgi:hypothetical protein